MQQEEIKYFICFVLHKYRHIDDDNNHAHSLLN